jgi:hypothetical protein
MIEYVIERAGDTHALDHDAMTPPFAIFVRTSHLGTSSGSKKVGLGALPKILVKVGKIVTRNRFFYLTFSQARRKKTRSSPMKKGLSGFFQRERNYCLVPTAGFELAT